MKRYALLAWLMTLLPLAACATQAEQIKAGYAWIRLLPADLPAGGYVLLNNQGTSNAILVSAQSSTYGSIMLHQSSTDMRGGDSMRMLDHLTIPALGQVALVPAGYHLMLQKATHSLKPGDKIDITLNFADGSHLQVLFLVRPANATD